MFGHKKKNEVKEDPRIAKLPMKDKKKVKKAIKEAKSFDNIPRTAQQTIPLERMFTNGIAMVKKGYYSMTLSFDDVDYALEDEERQGALYDRYCGLLNSFDPSINVSFTFLNKKISKREIDSKIRIRKENDELQIYRNELEKFLQKQFLKGNSGIKKTKFISFGIKSSSYKQARTRLFQIANETISNWQKLGVTGTVLTGEERLKVMFEILNMGVSDPFVFDWKKVIDSGLQVKDFIAPQGINFSKAARFELGETKTAVHHIWISATEITENFLSDLFSMNAEQVITLHLHSLDQAKALKMVRSQLTELDRVKMEEQKRAVRAGYDMDILPSGLVDYAKNAKKLMQKIQSQNERAYMISFIIMQCGKTDEELDNNVFEIKSICQKHNNELKLLTWQQEQGLVSSLPLAYNEVEIERLLPTSGLGIMVPFWTQELCQLDNPRALFYGVNSLTGNYIMCDRLTLKNPNALILGLPGGGKTMQAKLEILLSYFMTKDDILILDPEGEYTLLVEALGGQRIDISSSGKTFLNPLDINLNYGDDKDPLKFKADFVLSLCETILSRKRDESLDPIQRSIIDRSVRKIYENYFKDPKPENMPILEDLYTALLNDAENPEEAKYLATALEIYVHGSQNVFNHRTNIDIDNRLVSFDISGLGKQLQALGMLIVEDQIWGRVTKNRRQGCYTRWYCDEMHVLLRNPQTATFTVDVYKRFRKWGGIPTGMTQNVKDFLKTAEIQTIFDNTDCVCMLSQDPADAKILMEAFDISEEQMGYAINSEPGSGIMKFGKVIVPCTNKFPKNTSLYKLMTSKPDEVKMMSRA